jgi:hypothetical protein
MSAMARDLAGRSISGASCWVLRANSSARGFYEALRGQPVAERAARSDEETEIVEIAYGWRDLGILARE